MDFITSLHNLSNWKKDNYISIHVFIDRLTKVIYNKQMRPIINTFKLIKLIIDVVIWYHGCSNLIMANEASVLPESLSYYPAISYVSNRGFLLYSIF